MKNEFIRKQIRVLKEENKKIETQKLGQSYIKVFSFLSASYDFFYLLGREIFYEWIIWVFMNWRDFNNFIMCLIKNFFFVDHMNKVVWMLSHFKRLKEILERILLQNSLSEELDQLNNWINPGIKVWKIHNFLLLNFNISVYISRHKENNKKRDFCW